MIEDDKAQSSVTTILFPIYQKCLLMQIQQLLQLFSVLVVFSSVFCLIVCFIFSCTFYNVFLSNKISFMLSYYFAIFHSIISLNDQIHFIGNIRYFNLSNNELKNGLAILVLSFNMKLSLIVPFKPHNFPYKVILNKDHPYIRGYTAILLKYECLAQFQNSAL